MSIEWLNAAALAALGAAVVPLLVHLLQRRHATRLPFPSLRFLREARAASVRLTAPSDAWLLVLRTAIVAAAALAWAQPFWISSPRVAAADRAVTRAIVVAQPVETGEPAQAIADAIAAESGGAREVMRIDAPDLRAGIDEAARRLASAQPSRRELVILGRLPLGSLDDDSLAVIPADVGIRFALSDASAAQAAPFDGYMRLTDARDHVLQRVETRGATTVASEMPQPGARWPRLETPNGAALAPLQRIVAQAGAPALPAGRPTALVFVDGTVPSDVTGPRDGWMLTAIRAMRADEAIVSAAAQLVPGAPVAGPWITVAAGKDGQPAAAAAARGNELILRVSAGPDEFAAAVVLRGLLAAVAEPPDWLAHETETISRAQLDAWQRAPGPIPAERWRGRPPGDARPLWGVVLALLGLEAWVRRRMAAAPQERPVRHAA